MSQAKNGDMVTIHYTGYLKDGTEFESTKDKKPFTFTIGHRKIIPGFESAIVGMKEGETKSISIAPEHAYGKYHNTGKIVIEKSRIPSEIRPEIGMKLKIRKRNGTITPVTVTDVTGDRVTLDANHPLAGQELTFEVKLLKIL